MSRGKVSSEKVSANGLPLASPEAFRAARVAAQQRKIAAVHHKRRTRDDAVDTLAQRCVCPFDRGNIARLRIEQDRGDLATGCTILNAVEGAELERESGALMQRELQAAHKRTGTRSGQAALEALNGVNAGSAIVVARDDEAAAARMAAADEPDLMIPVGVSEEEVTAVVGRHTRQDRRKILKTDGSRSNECLRRGSNDNSGR